MEEAGEINLQLLNSRQRPVKGGYSIGHHQGSAGSIGCLVTPVSGTDDSVYILSNSHVLANSGTCTKGDPVLQPGPSDYGTINDKIADLDRWARFRYSNPSNLVYTNQVDAAIAGPIDVKNCDPSIAEINVIPRGIAPTIDVDDKVVKVGRTSHKTDGEIDAVNVRAKIPYPSGTVAYSDMIICRNQTTGQAFTEHGDSGSLVLSENGYAVALHVAGNSKYSFSCPIQEVLRAMQVSLVTAPIC